MTFSKYLSIGFALLALSGTTASASDASADRAASLQTMVGAKPEVSQSVSPRVTGADEGSRGDPCNRKDCCAMRTQLPSSGEPAAHFTDVG